MAPGTSCSHVKQPFTKVYPNAKTLFCTVKAPMHHCSPGWWLSPRKKIASALGPGYIPAKKIAENPAITVISHQWFLSFDQVPYFTTRPYHIIILGRSLKYKCTPFCHCTSTPKWLNHQGTRISELKKSRPPRPFDNAGACSLTAPRQHDQLIRWRTVEIENHERKCSMKPDPKMG